MVGCVRTLVNVQHPKYPDLCMQLTQTQSCMSQKMRQACVQHMQAGHRMEVCMRTAQRAASHMTLVKSPICARRGSAFFDSGSFQSLSTNYYEELRRQSMDVIASAFDPG